MKLTIKFEIECNKVTCGKCSYLGYNFYHNATCYLFNQRRVYDKHGEQNMHKHKAIRRHEECIRRTK